MNTNTNNNTDALDLVHDDECSDCVNLATRLVDAGARARWVGEAVCVSVPVKRWNLPPAARRRLELVEEQAADELGPEEAARLGSFAQLTWWETIQDVLSECVGVPVDAFADGRGDGHAVLELGSVGATRYVDRDRLHEIAQDTEAAARLVHAVEELVAYRDAFPELLADLLQGELDERAWHERQREAKREESRTRVQYVLRRDGVEVARGDEFALLEYVHRVHAFSLQHALTWEGFSISAE